MVTISWSQAEVAWKLLLSPTLPVATHNLIPKNMLILCLILNTINHINLKRKCFQEKIFFFLNFLHSNNYETGSIADS